jgi:hypothetical protein
MHVLLFCPVSAPRTTVEEVGFRITRDDTLEAIRRLADDATLDDALGMLPCAERNLDAAVAWKEITPHGSGAASPTATR